VFYEDAVTINVDALVSGTVDVKPTTRLVAASALTGKQAPLSQSELVVLGRLHSENWTSAAALGDDAEIAQTLAQRGLAVSDEEAEPFAELRRRDEQLTGEQWERRAALFHFMTRRRAGTALTLEQAEQLAPDAEGALDSLITEHGPPPSAFQRRGAQHSYPLCADDREGDLHETMRARRTARAFVDEPVSLLELSTLLRYTFGSHGYWRAGAITSLRKTVPSGGGMHPTEAYPIVLNVDGLPTGAYHYNVEENTLDLLTPLSVADARARVAEAVCGQHFFADAGVVVLLATRFFRSFWKYRRDARAYAVLLMDVGHLSQTFQLVATELGLGTFVTAAIDGPTCDALIEVDGVGESTLAVLGCGRATSERSVLDPDPLPMK
jgi:putative peptide maturation dehydrogenase